MVAGEGLVFLATALALEAAEGLSPGFFPLKITM
jgi:hypothetical protein